MKKLIIAMSILLMGLSSVHAVDTILVSGFINQGEEGDDNINEILTRSLIGLLGKVPGIAIISFDEVEELVEENGLWEMDEHDFETIEAMGLMMGAKKVVVGDYYVNNRTDEITGNYYVYSMQTGELLMTRDFEGDAGMDIFDTVDEVVKKVSFGLLGREIALGNVAFNIQEEGKEYAVYVNGQFQDNVTSEEAFSVEILADTDVEVSLRLIEDDEEKEVYRESVNVAEAETYTIDYTASGMVLVKALDLIGAKVFLDGEQIGETDDNGDYLISGLKSGEKYEIKVRHEDKVVDVKNASVQEGETMILVVGAGGKKFALGAKFMEGGGPSGMLTVGYKITPNFSATLGFGAAYYLGPQATVLLGDLVGTYNFLSLGDMKLGASGGVLMHLPIGATPVVSALLRADVEWKFLFGYLGARYSFAEEQGTYEADDGTIMDNPAIKPIMALGIRFYF